VSGRWERIWYPRPGDPAPSAVASLGLGVAEAAFRAAVSLRGALYDRRILGAASVQGCRVISVGNLTVGGSGKTPAVIHLAGLLQAAGRRVFVLSRGYGRRSRAALTFTGANLPSWEEVGDEPLLIARRCPGVTVMVGADRAALARDAARLGAEVVLLDDGMQHRRLGRDLDIAVVDEAAGLGNGRLLPRGPLREPPAALRRAGLIWLVESAGPRAPLPPFNQPVVRVRVRPSAVVFPDGSVQPAELLRGRRVEVLAGIARPERFVDTLRSLGAEIGPVFLFPDHHPFAAGDIPSSPGDALLITTEKDAMRLPPGARRPAVLRLGTQVVDGEAALLAAVAPGGPGR
jgi:tetraacyldisaccharide 4'-kinase